MIHGPDGGKLAAIAPAHCGSLAAGEAAVRSIKGFGAPALDQVGPMSYCDLNTMLDAAFPRGALNYWKSNFLARLSDEAIDRMIDCFARCPNYARLQGLKAKYGPDNIFHMNQNIRPAP